MTGQSLHQRHAGWGYTVLPYWRVAWHGARAPHQRVARDGVALPYHRKGQRGAGQCQTEPQRAVWDEATLSCQGAARYGPILSHWKRDEILAALSYLRAAWHKVGSVKASMPWADFDHN